MKTIIAILYAHLVKKQNKKWIDNPIKWQANTFKKLIKKRYKKMSLEKIINLKILSLMNSIKKRFLLETMKS
ncbi:MAG: hypothetical protein Ct9H90mP22_5290 [Gammaproteobacteria bacterium]|nr:MAG: hypothetical protein Ct9H90mP22_5290 [Gammaproteobacteria bacterium]